MSNFDHDPVEDFFERERNQIVSQHGNDVHWQGIVRQARAHRRSRVIGSVAGLAAAALVIGGVTYGAVLHNGTEPVTAATQDATTVDRSAKSAAAAAAAAAAKAAADAQAAARQAPVPKSFTAVSMSNVGGGNIFVLGHTECALGRGPCPALIGSTDNGRTWHQINISKGLDGKDLRSPDRGPSLGLMVANVRFANAKVGWVFGGDVQYTTDGGKTFRPYGHLGQVIDIETDGAQVLVTSADCLGDVPECGVRHVARANINDTGATTEVGTLGTGGHLGDLQVIFDGKQPYVSPRWNSAPTSGFEPQRVTDSGLEPLGALGGACGNPSEQDVIATADPAGGLFAFCAAAGGGAAGSIGMAVFKSADQGKTWAQVTPVGPGALVLINSEYRSFAAAGAKDVLAVSSGNDATHGSMQVSHDGGHSWTSPATPPPMPTRGWAWVGAAGGSTFYAISGDEVPAYWQSDDSGETWTKVGLTS